jgi:DNA-binding transcriptional MerR regulator
MDGYYSAVDAARLAFITRRQLDYWVEIGMVEPAITAPRGKAGTVKLFDFDGLFQLRILRAFVNAGISVQALRKIAEDDREKEIPEKRPLIKAPRSEPLDLARIVESFQKGFYDRQLSVLTEHGIVLIDLSDIHRLLKADLAKEASVKK